MSPPDLPLLPDDEPEDPPPDLPDLPVEVVQMSVKEGGHMGPLFLEELAPDLSDLVDPDLADPDLADPDLVDPDLVEPDLVEPDLSEPDLVELPDLAELSPEPEVSKPSVSWSKRCLRGKDTC